MKSITILALTLIVTAGLINAPAAFATTLSTEEQEFADLINDYRTTNGLNAVDVTVTMTDVAQAHVFDLATYAPYDSTCNLHSWSTNGPWSGGCYTPDHSNASLMWNKPAEFSGGAYTGPGFELIADGYGSAAYALEGFKSSSAHNDVLLNQGIWSSRTWASMGVGIYDKYYSIWLGDLVDPQGLVSTSQVPAPVTIWIFLAGLLGVAAAARRRA